MDPISSDDNGNDKELKEHRARSYRKLDQALHERPRLALYKAVQKPTSDGANAGEVVNFLEAEGETERLWEVAYSDGDHNHVDDVKLEGLLTAASIYQILDQAEVTSGPSGVEVKLVAITVETTDMALYVMWQLTTYHMMSMAIPCMYLKPLTQMTIDVWHHREQVDKHGCSHCGKWAIYHHPNKPK